MNTESNQTTKQMYRNLIRQTLMENKVKTVINTNPKTPRFFDKIEINDNSDIKVFKDMNIDGKTITLDWDNFYFDFTLDFAHCLAFLEDAIFLQQRGGNHDYKIEFKS